MSAEMQGSDSPQLENTHSIDSSASRHLTLTIGTRLTVNTTSLQALPAFLLTSSEMPTRKSVVS